MAEDSKATLVAVAGKTLILYDGLCGLCNRAVRFVLKRDRRDQFRFAPLGSALGRAVLARHAGAAQETICLVLNYGEPGERLLVKSNAVLEIAARLGGIWPALSILRVLPQVLRDGIYDLIARNRYEIAGKLESCPVPDAAVRHKFVQDHEV